MPTTITLAGILFTGTGVYEGFVYEKLVDWIGVENVDSRMKKRPNQPGAFSVDQTNPGSKVISIEGKFFGADGAAATLARELLTTVYADGRDVVMTVTDDVRTTSRVVKVVAVKIPWTPHKEFDFTIDTEAADPKRYGNPVTVSNSLAVAGSGLLLPSAYSEWTGTPGASPSTMRDSTGVRRTNLATNALDGTSLAYLSAARGVLSLDAANGAVRLTVNDTTAGSLAQRIQVGTTVAGAGSMNVTPGLPYTASLEARSSSGLGVNLQALYYDAAGAYMTAVSSGDQATGTSFVRRSFTFTPPAGAARVFFYAGLAAGTRTVGDTFDARNLSLYQGTATDFFSGATADADFGLDLDFGLDFGTTPNDGRLTVTNPGTTETTTTFVVRGGGMPDGAEIVNVATGERLTYVGPIVEGTTLEFDPRVQAVFVNGTNPSGRFLPNPTWWAVPKGASIEIQFLARGAVTGSPTLDATTSPAFY